MIDINDIGICIASVNNKCLPVLLSSIKEYVDNDIDVYLCINEFIKHGLSNKVIQIPNIYNSFGDAYNKVVQEAFKTKEYVLICNDDIVFNPYTIDDLLINIKLIQESDKFDTMGYLACKTDYSSGMQNIRMHNDTKYLGDKYEIEYQIINIPKISPICALISKSAWIDFKPINYFSDDIQCSDIIKKGYQHYIGTYYVHHVGSQTLDVQSVEVDKALTWLKLHDIDNYNIYKDVY